MDAKPRRPDAEIEALELAASLEARYGRLDAEAIIEISVREQFAGHIAAVSSFGADSAALLHLIAQVDPSLPIIFLDTGKHFGETLDYRDALAADLGLTDIRVDRLLPVHPARQAGRGCPQRPLGGARQDRMWDPSERARAVADLLRTLGNGNERNRHAARDAAMDAPGFSR